MKLLVRPNDSQFSKISDTTQSSLFYSGAFYDRIFRSSPRYAEQNQDISFWLAMVERYGSSVLELACGTNSSHHILVCRPN